MRIMEVGYQQLYGKEAEVQKARYTAIKAGFVKPFGKAEGAEWFSAPGRTEIGGNHTDHNHGHVLTAAVNLDIVGLARKTENGVIRLKSAVRPGGGQRLSVLDPRHLRKMLGAGISGRRL